MVNFHFDLLFFPFYPSLEVCITYFFALIRLRRKKEYKPNFTRMTKNHTIIFYCPISLLLERQFRCSSKMSLSHLQQTIF